MKDKSGNLAGVKIVKLAWEKDAATGRMNRKEVEGSEQVLEAQLVLIAAGFLGSQKYVTDAFGVELDARTNVKTEPDSFQTSAANIFVAGDMHTGQSLVVKAIRQGRECARAVDESLMGYSNMFIQWGFVDEWVRSCFLTHYCDMGRIWSEQYFISILQRLSFYIAVIHARKYPASAFSKFPQRKTACVLGSQSWIFPCWQKVVPMVFRKW